MLAADLRGMASEQVGVGQGLGERPGLRPVEPGASDEVLKRGKDVRQDSGIPKPAVPLPCEVGGVRRVPVGRRVEAVDGIPPGIHDEPAMES